MAALITAVTSATAFGRRSLFTGRGASLDYYAAPAGASGSSGRRPLLPLDVSEQPSFGHSPYSYGATQISESPTGTASPERQRRESSLDRVPEEVDEDALNEDEEDDWELEEQGLYKGSYSRIITLYNLVPLTSILTFVLLAFLPTIAYNIPRPPLPHPPFFPFPLSEILTAVSLWSLSHLLRLPTYSLFSFIRSPTITVPLSTIAHVLLHNLLRLAIFPILEIRQKMEHPMPTWRDWAFRRVWWIGLGWCAAEAIVGISQGYEQIALYRDVLVPEGEVEHYVSLGQGKDVGLGKNVLAEDDDTEGSTSHAITAAKNKHAAENEASAEGSSSRNGGSIDGIRLRPEQFRLEDTEIKMQVERDLDDLIALKEREELEEVYGVPVIRIPVFVSCLQRVSSIVFSMGLTLLLSASYLRCPISLSSLPPSALTVHPVDNTQPTNRSFYITFPIVLIIHISLSFLHTPLVLPRIGVHTAAYVGLLIGLGCLFAGLGMWDALS